MDERMFINSKLFEFGLSQKWLIGELERRFGILTDRTEISSAISGTRRGPKGRSIISNSVTILNDYERKYRNET